MRLPVGLVYDREGTGRARSRSAGAGSAAAGCSPPSPAPARPCDGQAACREQLVFPRRCGTGAHKGELLWGGLDHSRALRCCTTPATPAPSSTAVTRRAGTSMAARAYSACRGTNGITLIPDAHPGYITWEEYERNQQRLHESAQAIGADRRHGPPREGPALLQGLVLCGCCGKRMTVRYHSRQGHLVPEYMCQREGIEHGEAVCQRTRGLASIRRSAHCSLTPSIRSRSR